MTPPHEHHHDPMPEESRDALTFAADGAIRRNRPVWMLGLAGTLCVITIAALIYAVFERRGAQRDVQSGAALLAMARQASADIEFYENALVNFDDPYEPDPRLGTKLATQAGAVGLSLPQGQALRNTRTDRARNLRRQGFEYTFAEVEPDELDRVFRWIVSAQESVSGLDVTFLELRPMEFGWSLRVTLARWERVTQ